MKIAIISHTEHYRNNDGAIVGWGPTIKEINKLLEITDSIVHIAPFYNNPPPVSALEYCNDNIKYIPLKKSGGKGFQKLSIFKNLIHNLLQISKAIKDVDYIQFRAPTGIGIYVLPYLRFFNKKQYWVKYAGNWKDLNMPLGNKFQKKWLQKCILMNTKVTVNGVWKNEKPNIISFENPCLDVNDRKKGKEIVSKKKIKNKINFCFVGVLNDHKGVGEIIEAFSKINSNKIGNIHFVGDGKEKERFLIAAKKIYHRIIFHGFIPKDSISDIYSKSHYIILPSKSEGFPKVIGEAMNYGCIPIVSNVSCIDQYIVDEQNGYLLSKPNSDSILMAIEKVLKIEPIKYEKWMEYNYELSNKFTYRYYNLRLKTEIFK